MRRASVVINLDDYHPSENQKGPDSEDYRLERRWKRRELSNKRLKRNHWDSGTRSTVKSRGNMTNLTVKNGHISEDEMDEDYKVFLVQYNPDIDVVSDGNVDGSDNYIDIGYHSDQNDHCDSQYRTFLENYRGEEEERLQNEPERNTMLKVSKQRHETGNQGNKGSDSVRKQTGGLMKSQQNLEAKRGLSKKRPRQDVSGVPKSNCHNNVELDVVDEDYQIFLNSSCRIENDYMSDELIGKKISVMQNSQVSDHAFHTPEALSEVDEDYEQFLSSVRIVDDEVDSMPVRNTSKTGNMNGDDSNSSDSDLILLEPNQIHENTPFVSSKTYDSSWFETEMNPRDNWQLPACNHSQFRRRLMNDLQRPYDQEECDRLLHEVHQKRQKERHVETRQGVVKSYRTKGVNKSYLELYPDLAKAIAKFKQPERVLFLLRGFIFWLQNLTHEEIFQPWLDKSCLEILRKM
ncbi:hypothetical protein E2542_SST20533 [Spatholobus suberectus]|nr:hypothetical protein E2542_SST20533 [Spatholobus suberectus]